MPSNGFTERAQEALRTAQEIVQQKRHSQLDVEHILLALLKPRDGLISKIIEKLNGDPRALARRLDDAAERSPRLYSSYGGLAQIHISMRAQRVVSAAAEEAAKLNDEYIGVEHLFLAIAAERGGSAARLLSRDQHRPGPQSTPALQEIRGNARITDPGADGRYQALERYSHDLTAPGPRGPARPGDRPRRRDPPRDAGALPPHQEQPGADRRAGRGQDGHRRGPGPADRRRRRARAPARQARARARHGRAGRRQPLPRRVRRAAQGGHGRGQARPARRSSCSSTSCTPSSARARPRARSTRPTCSSRPWRAASCSASARPRWTSIASTSRRTPRWSAASPRSSWTSRRRKTPRDPARACAPRYEEHHGLKITDERAGRGGAPVAPLHPGPLPARQGHRPDGRGRGEGAAGRVQPAARAARPAKPRMADLEEQMEQAGQQQDYAEAARLKAELLIREEEYRQPSATSGSPSTTSTRRVDEEDVADVVARWTGIPVKRMLADEMQQAGRHGRAPAQARDRPGRGHRGRVATPSAARAPG